MTFAAIADSSQDPRLDTEKNPPAITAGGNLFIIITEDQRKLMLFLLHFLHIS